MSTHIFTSAAANYIPKARVLAHSIKRFHGDLQFHLVLADAVPERLRLDEEPFDSLLSLADLDIPDAERWAFKHNLVELSTAVKGPAIVKLLAMEGCSEVIYFDPDILVLNPLDQLLGEFRFGSVLLTPHLTEPERAAEAIRDNELSVLRHGVYNLGFIGVRNSEEGRRFARWWSSRLIEFCYDDIPQGLFTDQRWADLAPAYFHGCRILRDPVYNVCTWNLTHREVDGTASNGLRVNGQPIVFYHFSGFDSGAQQAMLDKYGGQMRGLYELRRFYEAECERMGQAAFAPIPWHYGYFDNGEPVSDAHRRLYRERVDLQEAFPNPFSTGDRNQSYYHWYEADHDAAQGAATRPFLRTASLTGLRGLVRHARSLSLKPAEYRIFLAVTEEDSEFAAIAARALLDKSHQTCQLFLIGSEHAVEKAIADAMIGGRFQSIALPTGAAYDQVFWEICQRFSDMGFLFVKASTVVTDYWDARLVWSLQGRQGVATISPLCDREPFTAVNPGGNSLPLGTDRLSTEQVDRLCARYSDMDHPEIPRSLEDCAYVSADAARAVHHDSAESVATDVNGFDRFHHAMRNLGYAHLLADHVYVGSLSPRTKGVPTRATDTAPPALLDLRRVMRTYSPTAADPPAIAKLLTPRHLHVMHNWGGGLERWVQDYCRADDRHQNFVLKSVGTSGGFGTELRLYRHIDDASPMKVWTLYPAIHSTVPSHSGYEQALSEIVDDLGIERILVSSVIGHSLDVLRIDPPTIMVCHDYYPFCPALSVTFGRTLCRRCEEPDLDECSLSNPHHRFFPTSPPAHWLELRSEFLRKVRGNRITLVAPTPSVVENYVRLLPGLEGSFRIVPHGTSPMCGRLLKPGSDPRQRLRVIVPGSLAPNKGLSLFRRIADELASFADVILLGVGEGEQEFQKPGITQIPKYARAELPDLLQSIRPDLGLLLSVVAETYSYTLQELFESGIPALATRVGSFCDRIEDGVNGFLCDPSPKDLLRRLRELSEDRGALARVHETLCRTPIRTLAEMLADYRGIMHGNEASATAYFCPDARCPEPDTRPLVCAQLFWRLAEQPFSEPSSVRSFFELAERTQSVGLHIPPMRPAPAQLRLDLGNEPVVLLLRRMRLYSNDRECLWSWDGEPELFSDDAGCWHTSVLAGRKDDGALLCITGNDPQVILPLDSIALVRLSEGGTLELDVSGPPEGSNTTSFAADILLGQGKGLPLPNPDMSLI